VEPRAYPTRDLNKLDPDPIFAELTGTEPMMRVQLPYGEPAWLATRHEDVKVVLNDSRFSRAAAVGRDEPRARPFVSPPGNILLYDPPAHSRLRWLVSKAFTARRIEELRPRVQQIADGLVDDMVAEGSPGDLVEMYGLPLPVTVICELLGVPDEVIGDFRLWSDAFLSTTRFPLEQVTEYAGKMRDYIIDLIRQRRREPKDDLVSALVAARDNDDKLTEDELLSLVQAILIAGHETTASEIPNFVYTLLTHPEQLAAIKADPGLIPQAVEELLRFVPLGAGADLPRYALEDVELGGVTVRAGEPVVPAVAAANHDSTVYADPLRFDLNRKEATHVGFGYGAHYCLGAPLARMELQVTVSTLLSRLPNLRLDDEANGIDWKSGLSTRGPERLMLAWDEK
jgi:cytochrome P450